MSNSHFWKRPGAQDITIFGFHVGPHIPMGVYGGIYTGAIGAKAHTLPSFSSQGAAPPGPTARADARAADPFPRTFVFKH